MPLRYKPPKGSNDKLGIALIAIAGLLVLLLVSFAF